MLVSALAPLLKQGFQILSTGIWIITKSLFEMEKIGVIGLGYVGLPLAVEFGKILDVVGFDINEARIGELKKGIDRTLEVDNEELKSSKHLRYSHDAADLKAVNYFIVTVPTPVDEFHVPDLRPLQSASK